MTPTSKLMAKPFVTRLETAGGIAFGAAIAVSPLVIRLRGIPIAVSPCDILMALSALLCTPSLFHRAAGRVPLEAVTPALPLIAVSALSAVATGNLGGGAPDIIQLCLYGGLAAIGSAVVSKTTAGCRSFKIRYSRRFSHICLRPFIASAERRTCTPAV